LELTASAANTQKERKMAYQCIKYRLTAEGTVPEFLYLGEDGVGGVYGVPDPATPSPRDLVMIGFSLVGAEGDYEIVPSAADLAAYLADAGSDWTQPSATDPGAFVPFDADEAAASVWAKLDALNAA
jgi:hypothetical protein